MPVEQLPDFTVQTACAAWARKDIPQMMMIFFMLLLPSGLKKTTKEFGGQEVGNNYSEIVPRIYSIPRALLAKVRSFYRRNKNDAYKRANNLTTLNSGVTTPHRKNTLRQKHYSQMTDIL